MEILEFAAKYLGPQATVILAIWLMERHKKKNGGTKALEQHLDMAITEHFDQLRRDLTTSIEKATENSIMRYLWEAERRRDAKR